MLGWGAGDKRIASQIDRLSFDAGRRERNGQWYVVPALKQRVSYRNAEWPCSAITPVAPLFGRPADPQSALAQPGSGSRSPGYKLVRGRGLLLQYYALPPPDIPFNETHVPGSICLVHASLPQELIASKLHDLHHGPCSVRREDEHALPSAVRSSYERLSTKHA